MIVARTLGVVHGLVGNLKMVMKGADPLVLIPVRSRSAPSAKRNEQDQTFVTFLHHGSLLKP